MPTVPTQETVLRVRFAVVVALRVVAVAALVLWIGHAAWVVLESRVFGPSSAMIRSGFVTREPVLKPIVLGALFPALAVAAAAVAPGLARRLVPMPKPGCPFCDHGALPETGSKCPECGRELPEQLLARPEPTKLR